jgi:hypothetical protein
MVKNNSPVQTKAKSNNNIPTYKSNLLFFRFSKARSSKCKYTINEWPNYKTEISITSLPLIDCFGDFSNSWTTCSDSNVMKQKPFLWFFVLSNGISTSTIWKEEIIQDRSKPEDNQI